MSLLIGKGLNLSRAGAQVLEQVDLHLEPGEMLGLIGPNGAGKSTLLKVICGLLTPDRGEIRFEDRPLSELEDRERARAIGYLAQNGEAHWPLAVNQILTLGRLPYLARWQQPSQRDRAAVRQVIRETGLDAFAERSVNTLSAGEKARVLLARALVGKPKLLLADEPVAALDPGHQLDVMALLRQYSEKENGVMVVLHDLPLAAHYCDRLLLLDGGRAVVSGDSESVLTPQHLSATFGIRNRGSDLKQVWERV